MAKKIAMFNHKGGVGKTTLAVNIGDAMADRGKTVLLVDADPQCNLSSFYLEEAKLDELLGASSDTEGGGTIWSAVQPVFLGRGGVQDIETVEVRSGIHIVPGDVMLAEFEEELSRAWADSFARRTRGYDVMCGLSDAVDQLAEKVGADVIIYDVGPNVGPLNRAVILDSDFFITPVACDLFSLRALTTVGRAISRWVRDWRTVKGLATPDEQERLLVGNPVYLGYIASAFKVASGRSAANPHEYWEARIAPRVTRRIADELRSVDPALVPTTSYKIGSAKHFHSLAPEAQKLGIAIGKLRGHVNSGHYPQVDEARDQFAGLAREIERRAGIA